MMNNTAPRRSRLRPEFLRVAVALAAGGAILTLLLVPSLALGVTTTHERAGSHAEEYLLGATVRTTGSANLGLDEEAGFSTVKFSVTGPNAVNPVTLPVKNVVGHSLTDQLSQSLRTGGAVMDVDVTFSEILGVQLGFGYGYGYKGLTALANIEWVISYKPPVNLVSQPEALPGFFANPAQSFSMPGGGGGQNVDATQVASMFQVPGMGVPPTYAVFTDTPLDIAATPWSSFYILLDGDTSSDILVEVGLDGFTMGEFLTNQSTTTGVAADQNGTPWMVYQDVNGHWFVGGFDDQSWPPSPDSTKIVQLQHQGKFPEGDITSLTYDGMTNVLMAVEFQENPSQMIQIWEINPQGQTPNVQNVYGMIAGPTGGGFSAFAVNKFTNPPMYLGANEEKIGQFDLNSGMHVGNIALQDGGQEFDGNIVGLTIVPDSMNPNDPSQAQMVIVTDDSESANPSAPHVFMSGLAQGGSAASNIPKAIAQHGGKNAFVLIEPDTIHYVPTTGLNAGTSLGNFQTPDNGSTNVESLAYLSNTLFAIDNSNPTRKLYKNTVTGGGDGTSMVGMGGWTLVTTLGNNVGNIGAMASRKDPPTLYAAEAGSVGPSGGQSGKIHIMDASGNTQGLLGLYSPPQSQNFVPNGLNGLAFVGGSNNPAGATGVLVGVLGNQWFRVNPSQGQGGGEILSVDFVSMGPPFEMRGLTVSSMGILTAVDRDAVAAFLAVIPGTPAPESTAIGDYTAAFLVDLANTSSDPADAETDFSLAKTAVLGLAITDVGTTSVAGVSSPTVGITGSSVVVSGTILDPTVTQVGVQAELSLTTLVGAPASAPTGASPFTEIADQNQYQKTGYWHFTSSIAGLSAIVNSNNTVAYYGNPASENQQPNYCSPSCQGPQQFQTPNSGEFSTSTFTVGSDTTLSFKTHYDTEPVPEWDRKEIWFVPTSGSPQKLAQIIDPYSIFVPGFDPNSVSLGEVVTKSAQEQFIMVPSSYQPSGVPAFVSVNLPLPASLAGVAGMIQFRFDTGDPFGNDFLGWIVDDVKVEGAGSQLLSPATVDTSTEPATWTLTMSDVQDGTNTVSISAARTAYDNLTESVDLTLIKDTTAPVVDTLVVVSLVGATESNIVGGVTSIPSVKISGTYTEETPSQLSVYINGKSIKKQTSAFTGTYEANGTLSTASSGVNTIAVVVTDQAGLCNTTPTNTTCTAATSNKTLVVNLDNTAPVITKGSPKYPLGYNSVRAGKDDFVVFHLDASDSNGIQSVKAKSPNSTTFDVDFRDDIPDAVKDQWGVDKDWVLPFKPSAAVFPGTLTMAIQVTDNAGNVASGSMTATVTAALGGFVINLLPGQNFVSLPVIPSIANTTTLEANVSLTGGSAGMVDDVDGAAGSDQAGEPAIDSILYYDATNTSVSASDRWSIWTSSTEDTDSLTKLRTGKGYLFQMKADAFATSAPLAAGLPSSPAPIQFTYTGTYLLTGQSIPPSYPVEGTGGAWNMVGFHSEDNLAVTTYLQSLEAPQRIWASVLEYKNYINFPLAAGASPEVVLGTYGRLLATSEFTLGRGFWLFALDDGQIVP